ncbi:MAG TPA: VCBS repeat-containing protein, partial [Candidatus Udaeobacter sp.]|nr:VCBS repeat-containing protein [Candidatus Udaeobacter sp.]
MKTETLHKIQRNGRFLRPLKKPIGLGLIAGLATMLVFMTASPSSEAQSFVDVSDSAGIDGTSLNKSWGSPCWGDINNDGHLDVLVSTHGVAGQRPFIYTN